MKDKLKKELQELVDLENIEARSFNNSYISNIAKKVLTEFDKLDNSKVLGKFEGFTLKEYDDWNIYLGKEGGEGIIIKKAAFKAHINNFFEKMVNPEKPSCKQINFLNK